MGYGVWIAAPDISHMVYLAHGTKRFGRDGISRPALELCHRLYNERMPSTG